MQYYAEACNGLIKFACLLSSDLVIFTDACAKKKKGAVCVIASDHRSSFILVEFMPDYINWKVLDYPDRCYDNSTIY